MRQQPDIECDTGMSARTKAQHCHHCVYSCPSTERGVGEATDAFFFAAVSANMHYTVPCTNLRSGSVYLLPWTTGLVRISNPAIQIHGLTFSEPRFAPFLVPPTNERYLYSRRTNGAEGLQNALHPGWNSSFSGVDGNRLHNTTLDRPVFSGSVLRHS